ncbi:MULTISPECIES: VCBS repeat-containing protein [unclassified Paraflavitalea]|uniref:VCBS repeat-containing protein n=1 Tax=unclassified Paraflavitalea TaxID=2798305 RepID=UPI003D327D57
MRAVNFYIVAASLTLLTISCNNSTTLFEQIPANKSGIQFENTITKTDSINVLDFENVYNGGGVGVGDFNNDGLLDLYFTGNLVSNKLYLNKGDFKFEDITEKAQVSGDNKWSRGVAVIDINNDGLLDMYVSATLKRNPVLREHMLFVNQGNNKEGIPTFKNLAKEYGLADTTQGTQAAFFDYDNDGDLDVYMVNNEIIRGDYPNRFRPAMKDGSHPNTDRLFRNDWNENLKHPVFTNVSKEAGILIDGYGHSVVINDFNKDGWKDIYVTNDYLSNDLLWINNKNGTFTESLNLYFKHTSANAMGTDVIDVNNDGLDDVVALDMNPEDNYRKKMMMNPNSYQTYQNSDYFGYGYQYVRNTLQINQGPRVLGNDSIGAPIFSEIAFFSGIAETDWSWTPVVADFDNDGNRDIIITNGFPKDVTDHDFVAFRNEAFAVANKRQLLDQIPEVKLHNYAYRNKGNLQFENKTNDWGLTIPTFSNGSVYADLDNDGDLDLVLNNINDKAGLYRNTLRDKTPEQAHFVKVVLKGDAQNVNGIGANLTLFANGTKQSWEHTPYRGYLSSVPLQAFFGLGASSKIDSLLVYWPNGKFQKLMSLKVDSINEINIQNAVALPTTTPTIFDTTALFSDVTKARNINFIPQERDYVDFNVQKLLPHKLSEYGPGLAAGDLNGDGLDDFVSAGSFSNSGELFFQSKNGSFIQKKLLEKDGNDHKRWEELGMLLIDIDGDKDLDIYAASGGYENPKQTNSYQDHLYLNDGRGNFSMDTTWLPTNYTSKSCARAVDFDHDGDLDIVVAGRVEPWFYPKPVSSFVYRNDSKPGAIKLTDVTSSVAADLNNAGLVCDILVTDVDKDGWDDLLLAGEWMPVTLLKNTNGRFQKADNGLSKYTGWWNSIVGADFDNDGDIDYIAGNMGQNSFYRATPEFPAHITAKDFDNNGSYDAFPSLFLPDINGVKKEFPAQTRDDIVKQMIGMRTNFQNYKQYAMSTMDEVITPDMRKNAIRLEANTSQSVFLRNDGTGKLTMEPLPMQAQWSMLNGMVVDDFNNDGNLDLCINTNDYGTEVSVGRYDALNGLVFLGNGKGGFAVQSILQSGIFIPGNGKALVQLADFNGNPLLAASQNRGPFKLYKLRASKKLVRLNADETVAVITLRNGTKQRREFPYGASFLSQSSRIIWYDNNITAIELYSVKGKTRTITQP